MIALCLPGKWYSGEFLQCLDSLYHYFAQEKIEWFLRQRYSANVFFSRNMLLGVDPGDDIVPDATKPFGGRDYDYILWIDADAIFSVHGFARLMEADKDFVGGIARPSAEEERLNCGRLNQEGETSPLFKKHLETIEKREDGLVEVDYAGLHFVLMKRGVMEKVGYPWFMPYNRQVKNKMFFPSEDIGFCLRARAGGVRIFIDPGIRVGHERLTVIWP